MADLDVNTESGRFALVSELAAIIAAVLRLPHTLHRQYAVHQQNFIRAMTSPPERWAHFSRPEAKRRAFLLINQLETFMPSWQAGRWDRERSAMLDTLTAVWRSTLEADRV